MKNSDMKIIAIILSIALFFTIVTSNAVSIASVVFLAKGETAQSGTAGAAGDSTSTADNSATNGGSTVSPSGDTGTADATPADNSSSSAATPADNSSSSAATPASNGTSSSNAGSSSSNAGSSSSNAGSSSTSTSKIDKEALAMYQKASKAINQNAVAGYTKKSWQAIEGDLQLSKGQSLASTFKNIIMSFMTQEADAEEKINAKGSDDAKNRMAPGDCSESYIESVTKTTKGNNYVIKIVMKDTVNPSYDDADGLVKMSKEFLDFKDVQKEVQTNDTVKAVVKSLDGTITYKAYTITAEMTKDGKFVSITHYGVGDMKANVNAALVGDLEASGALSFNAKYYNFKY
ncbi:MAG: hypothetical protein ACI4VW_06170 [Acutalibacteraceae bacterium]